MTRNFERFAGWSAVLTALTGLVFTVAFAIVVRDGTHAAKWISAGALLAGGIVGLAVWLALYHRLRDPEPQFAALLLIVGIASSIGAALHGAYDLGVLAHPVGKVQDLPSSVDPRGLATFGLAGAALAGFGWLAVRTGRLPRFLSRLAVVDGGLLIVLYVGRLTVLDPHANLIKVVALLSGLVLTPVFYAGFGRELLAAVPGIPVPPRARGATSA
jgi:hypothetical protein